MAKGDDSTKTQTPTGSASGGTTSQMPQQNQYLTGNPSTQSNANTDWMNPNSSTGVDMSKNTGVNGGNTSQPVQDGTMLGQVTSGAVNSPAPLGFEQDKWADPTKGTSLKYQVGRMAASGMPIDQIASKVGAKVIGPDKIQYPDGFVADIYFDYGGPNQRVQYTDVTPQGQYMGQGNQPMPGNSMFGQQQGNQQPNFMQQMFQQMLAGRSAAAGQQFNPTGGQTQQPITAQDSRTIPSNDGSKFGGGNPGMMIPPTGYTSNQNTGVAGGYQGNGSGLQPQIASPAPRGTFLDAFKNPPSQDGSPWNNGQATDQGPYAWGGRSQQPPMPGGPKGGQQPMPTQDNPWRFDPSMFGYNPNVAHAGNPDRSMPQ